MGFFKKIDKVFKASDNFNLMERTEVDVQIEENIEKAGIQKFATSDYGDLYLRVNELGGFLILETIVVSATNLKSKKGSALTKIDYNISVEEAEKFKEEKYDEVRFEINGNEILFSVLTS
jgi:uncharacterized protein YjfI (DUF2170 family)